MSKVGKSWVPDFVRRSYIKNKQKNKKKKLAQEALSKKDYNNRFEHLCGNSLRAGLS